MPQKRRFNQNKRPQGRSSSPDTRTLRRPPEVIERPRPVVYGKPFVLVEDSEKNTFVFQGGEWVAYSASIAECRQTCLVKELPQRVNNRIRYEVRIPQ